MSIARTARGSPSPSGVACFPCKPPDKNCGHAAPMELGVMFYSGSINMALLRSFSRRIVEHVPGSGSKQPGSIARRVPSNET